MLPSTLTLELVPTDQHGLAVRMELLNEQIHRPPQSTFRCRLFDEECLRSLLGSDLSAYGAALRDTLFADQQAIATYRELRAAALNRDPSAALRLHLILPEHLQAIRWELLVDPVSHQPLGSDGQLWLSRCVPVDDVSPPLLRRSSGEQRVLLAIAAPNDAERWNLAPIDRSTYEGIVRGAWGGSSVTVIPAIWQRLTTELSSGYDILILVAHGRLVKGQPWLYLIDDQENTALRSGDNLAALLRSLGTDCPRLVVLVSCAGAGMDDHSWDALGPRLARAGVPAVVAAYGALTMDTAAIILDNLFRDLRREGRIDRALQRARLAAAQQQRADWWRVTLFNRWRDGQIWEPIHPTSLTVAPFKVPYRRNPLFCGRERELAELKQTLCGAEAVTVVLTGMAGVGKSQLASECAHRLRDHFPGGVFWLDMSTPDQVPAQIAACGGVDGLNLPGWNGLSLEDQVRAVQRAWQQPIRRLLIFDNLEERTLLRQWRPTTGGAQVLVTSRRSDWRATDDVHLLPLRPTERNDSYRILLGPRARIQQTTIADLLTDPLQQQAADAICTFLGDLPLALALAGAYLEDSNLSLSAYRQRLEQTVLEHPSLGDAQAAESDLPTAYRQGVAAALSLSYNRLDRTRDEDAAALTFLHRLAWLAPEPVPLPLLTALADGDADDQAAADPMLRRLRGIGLIDRREVQLHRLTAAFVRGCDPEPEKTLAATVVAMLKVSDHLNDAFERTPPASIPYRPHYVAVCQQETRLSDQVAAHLLTTTGYILYLLGEYAAARPLYERALAIRERTLGPDHPDTATSLNNLAWLLYWQGEYAAARPLYERALAIRERTLGPDHPDTARIIDRLAKLLSYQGEYTMARLLYERVLAVYERTLGLDHPETAASLDHLAGLLATQGEYAAARLLYELARVITERTLGLDHPRTARILHNLGLLLYEQGEYVAARLHYEQALAICERTLGPDHLDTAASLTNLALLLYQQGEYAAARPLFERALTICERTLGPDHPLTATSLNHLALLLYQQGEYAAARPLYERALAIRERTLGPDHPQTQWIRDRLRKLGD